MSDDAWDETDRPIRAPEPNPGPSLSEIRRAALAKGRATRAANAAAKKTAKPRPAPVDTTSPEFCQAVAAAVAELIAQGALPQPDAPQVPQQEADADEPGADRWMQRLALEFARISDQGSNRKRIPPEVQERRDRAHERMLDLIEDHQRRGSTPEYQLRGTVYIDDTLVVPTYVGSDHVLRPVRIGWPGIPNQAMAPMNAAARQIFAAYSEWIGGPGADNAPNQLDKPRINVIQREAQPVVGTPRNPGLSLMDRDARRDYTETRILGTKHPSFREIS